jgi:hypothetical protein
MRTLTDNLPHRGDGIMPYLDTLFGDRFGGGCGYGAGGYGLPDMFFPMEDPDTEFTHAYGPALSAWEVQ